MMRDKITARLDPKAPMVVCPDCEEGSYDCAACDGLGYYETPYPSRCIRDACDMCVDGKIRCRTCDGAGEFPDPTALLECPECAEFIDDETVACLGGCGFIWRAA